MSHFLIAIASFLLITIQVEIQVEKRKAQFRSSAVDIGKLSPASKVEPFFTNGDADLSCISSSLFPNFPFSITCSNDVCAQRIGLIRWNDDI